MGVWLLILERLTGGKKPAEGKSVLFAAASADL